MTTKIKPTDKGTWIVYEDADSDCPEVMEIEEFDTYPEAKEWLDDFNAVFDSLDEEDLDD
jgi:hypothetical protein